MRGVVGGVVYASRIKKVSGLAYLREAKFLAVFSRGSQASTWKVVDKGNGLLRVLQARL